MVAHQFHNDFVYTILCIKLDSYNLRLLKICGISFFVYIITIVHLFNRQ